MSAPEPIVYTFPENVEIPTEPNSYMVTVIDRDQIAWQRFVAEGAPTVWYSTWEVVGIKVPKYLSWLELLASRGPLTQVYSSGGSAD